MTIAKDATGQNFTSAISISNPFTNSTVFTICAFTTDGVFVGGSSFAVPPYGRFFAVSPTASGVLGLNDFLLPVKSPIATGPGSGTGGGGVPAAKDIHLYTDATGGPVSAGFVGNNGQFLTFYSVPTTECCAAYFPHAGTAGGFNTVFYVANPTTTPINVTIKSYDDSGNVRTTSPRMAIPGLARIALTASELGISGMGQVSIQELNRNRFSALAVIVYPTSAVGGASVSVQTPAYKYE